MTQSPPAALEQRYELRRDAAAARHADLTTRWNRIANVRLAAALILIVCLVWAAIVGRATPLVPGAVALIAFVWLVRLHRALGKERRRAGVMRDLNADALARVARAWRELPLRDDFQPPASHPFAADLDLFGRASLFHLLDVAETPMGRRSLRASLLVPAVNSGVRRRQEAVAAMAPALEWRQDFAVRGRISQENPRDPEPFLAWAERGEPAGDLTPLIWLTRVSTVLLVIFAIANVAGATPFPIWLIFVVINFAVVETRNRAARGGLEVVAQQHHAIGGYADLLEALVAPPADAGLIRTWQERLRSGEVDAPERLRQLGQASAWVVPSSALMYFPLQAVFAWDVHVMHRLEQWRGRSGRRVRDWLDVIGEAEAISGMAGLAHDNPDWSFPTIDSNADALKARELAHPLIAEGVRIANDVQIGPPGTFFLLTGSNMSGKSTLLRAIGVNIVLANAGAPVCAELLTLPPLALWTSVHVEDSLEEGVSFFMAELKRLKAIVDAAEAAGSSNPRLFFLLDEILQGTNTAERQIAARQIVRRLVDRGAIGAVSTHDLTLVDGPELHDVAEMMHLRDLVSTDGSGVQMSFDYKLRPGLATSTNALKLMEIVFGLPGPEIANARSGQSRAIAER